MDKSVPLDLPYTLQAAGEIQAQLDDLARHTQLCNMFDCSDFVKPAYEAVMEAKEAMVMAKDVWDCASMVEQQFKVLFCSCLRMRWA